MPFRIKSRLSDLDKRQVDLISELECRGIYISNKSELSSILKLRRKGPKAEKVLHECNEILTAWENEKMCDKDKTLSHKIC